MRYRDINTDDDIIASALSVANLVGQKAYRDILNARISKAEAKGYIAPFEKKILSLTQELRVIETERRRKKLSTRIFQTCPEGANLLLGIGQTIPHLSENGKKKLSDSIQTGISDDKLRALNHEFRVAERISNVGYDVHFADLETDSLSAGIRTPDIVASRGELAFDVEAKNVTNFIGLPVNPADQDKLWNLVRSGFTAWEDENTVPIVNVSFDGRFSSNQDYHRRILAQVNSSTAQKITDEIDIGDNTRVKYLGAVPFTSAEHMKFNSERDRDATATNVILRFVHPRLILRLTPTKIRNTFKNRIYATISEASKQCSGTLPAVIWCHIEYISEKDFLSLNGQDSFLKSVADRVFLSPKREHVVQLIFSGASLKISAIKKGIPIVRCGYRSIIFNSPTKKYGGLTLFPS
ncbi:hypothetical protein [Novacetimonas cocois]|uniref:hypothetical protein n=1 Tax=Novacetimonas cocois TaxID=1747507 RepID=UPI001057E67B|nr:hypothetical protein [Novacetimonas cocois]